MPSYAVLTRSAHSTVTRRHTPPRLAMTIITLLSIATISTGAVLMFGVPRNFVISLVFTVYMTISLNFRISQSAMVFAGAYFLGILPGTIIAFFDGNLAYPSFIQFLAALITFSVVASYQMRWLELANDSKKVMAVELVIIFFFVISLIELAFYMEVGEIRLWMYDLNSTMSPEVTYFRDTELYLFPRPTGFFSEASNFARFMGIIIALHMVVSKFSLRSLFWLLVFTVLTRSASIFFAGPVMVLAFLHSSHGLTLLQMRRKKNRNFWIAIIGGGILFVAIAAAQMTRFEKAREGSDGSLDSRLGTPLLYLMNDWKNPLFGSGATPQGELQEFTLSTEVLKGRTYLDDIEGAREAIASTILVIVAMGLLGLSIFLSINVLAFGRDGLIYFASFLFANLLNAGYNSVAMYVPLGLTFGMMLYLRNRTARRPIAKASPQFNWSGPNGARGLLPNGGRPMSRGPLRD